MSGLNKVMLIGNLGRDPEKRTMQSGDSVVSFSLATSESWKDKATGERKDRVEWHNIVVFNEGLGRILEQYCRKGSKIYIEGALRTREYTDRDGNKRRATEIVLGRFNGELVLLDSKGGGRHDGGEAAYGTTKSREPATGDPQPRALSDALDDDIPF